MTSPSTFPKDSLERPDFFSGNRVMIPVPLVYQEGFQGRAFVMEAGRRQPFFKVALSIKAVDGYYYCSLSVFLGRLKVWASDHLSRFQPVGSCVMELMKDGDLQLKDDKNQIGWQTGTSGQGVQRVVLLKIGNLVLLDSENYTKWQSFDFPADVMLRGQQLTVPARLISSSANSSAFYSFEIQPDKVAMYMNLQGNNYSYWELKPQVNDTITKAKLSSRGLKFLSRSSQTVAEISVVGPQPIKLASLRTTGNLGLYYYSAATGEFEASNRAIDRQCDLPLPCGTYGICTLSNTCSCVQVQRKHYAMFPNCDQSISQSFCGSSSLEMEMVQLHNVDSVLRTALPKVNVTEEECLSSCMQEFSCAAAMYSNGESIGLSKECYHYGMVGGVRQIERRNLSSYWIRIPKEKSTNQKKSLSLKKKVLIVAGAVDGLTLCLFLGGLSCYLLTRRRRRRTDDSRMTNN